MTPTLQTRQAAAIAPADPMQPHLYRVRRTRRETRDTFTVELAPVHGKDPLPFLPGQFNMLYAFGVGECAISISGDPAQPETLMHTTRVVGSVTRALYALKPGATMGIRGPFGSAWPIRQAEECDVVLVAGGIGLAPLRPVLCHIMAHRNRFGHVVLLYGTRTPQDILFRREIQKWSATLQMSVFVTVDRAESGWHGNVGVVTSLIRRAPFDRLNTIAMVCGPEIMMHYTVLELLHRGVDEDRIYLSMERNMKCATGFCGHCQFGPAFICKDGPVFRYDILKPWLEHREI